MGVRGLSLPFSRRPSSAFGRRWLVLPGRAGFWNDHEGTDWSGPRGTPLPALGNGRVYANTFTSLKGNQVGVDYGRIDGHNWKSRWHMLDKPSPFNIGDPVRAGETLGGMGMSGTASNGIHGHGELFRDGVLVDMMRYLDYTGFLSDFESLPIPSSSTASPLKPVQEDEMYMIASPGGQGLVVGNRYIDFGTPANVQGTTGVPVMTTTKDMHQRVIGALAQEDGLPILVAVAGGDGTIYQLIGDRFAPLVDIETVQQLQGLGASTITISKSERDNWLKVLA